MHSAIQRPRAVVLHKCNLADFKETSEIRCVFPVLKPCRALGFECCALEYLTNEAGAIERMHLSDPIPKAIRDVLWVESFCWVYDSVPLTLLTSLAPTKLYAPSETHSVGMQFEYIVRKPAGVGQGTLSLYGEELP
jgi:hypothetical protein